MNQKELANIFGPYQKSFWAKGPNFGGEWQ